jgi:hypothetical protein
MIDVAAVPSVRQGFGKLPCQPDPLVELTERQQPGIAGNLFAEGTTTTGLDVGKSSVS